MRKRLWLVAGAAATVELVVAAAAAATSKVAARPSASAAPFAQSWSQVPRSPQARQARQTLVFGQEQDVDGFNVNLTCCNEYWAGVQTVPVIRGAYIVNNRLQHVADLVTAGKATRTSLSFTIRPNAYWYWGGKKLPVTYKDFVYTWKAFVNPSDDVVTRDGYDQI